MLEKETTVRARIIIEGDENPGTELVLNVLKDSFGRCAVDVTGLYEETGVMMLDRGFTSTAGCESGITYINGEKGLLLYRGYPIEELAEHSSFIETAYLLLKGELPPADKFKNFESCLRINKKNQMRSLLNDQIIKTVERRRRSTPLMTLISSVVSDLDSYDGEKDVSTDEGRHEIVMNLIAKIPTIVALAYRYTRGLPVVYPRRELSYTENFLRMCFADSDAANYYVDPVVAKALDRILILHADHEQNASTSTVRASGSTGISPYTAISNGIHTLWGPKHGGANEAVIDMLEKIGSVENVPDFLAKVVRKEDGIKLMGFGHRVYKECDPRAKIMSKTCHKILDLLGIEDPLLKVAVALEEGALKNEYFKTKKLYPNVDFYSGITLRAMGFEKEMFTPIFALARTVGWAAQWREMVEGPHAPIERPRQHYVGPMQRHYVAPELR